MLGRRQRTRVRNGTQGAVNDADDDNEYEDEAGAEWQADSAGDAAVGPGASVDAEADGDEEEKGAGAELDQYDDEYDETDEYAEDDDEYDETDEYEEDDDEYTDDYDEDSDESEDEDADGDARPEPFTPPTFLEAAKQAFRPRKLTPAAAGTAGDSAQATASSATSGRAKAQPATGTEEDAKAVHQLDRREQTIGYVLGFGLVALSVLAYESDRHYTNKVLTKQLAVRHAAPEVLAIFALIGLLTLLATFFKRRALVGFVLTFGGLALLQTLGLFGIIYLGAGGWLIFRAMQRSPRSRARQAALADKSDGRRGGAGAGSRGAAASSRSTSARATSGTGSTAAAARSTSASAQRQIGRNNRSGRTTTSRGAPSPSGRYTPPKQARRPVPPKQPEAPEPSNRLSAWLRK